MKFWKKGWVAGLGWVGWSLAEVVGGLPFLLNYIKCACHRLQIVFHEAKNDYNSNIQRALVENRLLLSNLPKSFLEVNILLYIPTKFCSRYLEMCVSLLLMKMLHFLNYFTIQLDLTNIHFRSQSRRSLGSLHFP